jgi:dTDP-L-rhamnose 4-epimerase
MAAALARSFGPAAPRPVVTGAWRAGDVRHVCATPALAEQLFGFRAEVGFAEGMAELARSRLRG